MTNNIVGPGPLPSANTGNIEADAKINQLWKNHAKKINADGTRVGAEALMWMACFAWIESGEALLLRRPALSSDGLDIPLTVELLEADMLDHTKNRRKSDGSRIVNGVELNARRKVSAYHILKE